MEEFLLQPGPAYKRPRLEDPIPVPNFLDGVVLIPFGFIAVYDYPDPNMAGMQMEGNFYYSPMHDFGPMHMPDWRYTISRDSRDRCVYKLSQALMHNMRYRDNMDNRPTKWLSIASMIENKAFKMANSRNEYYNILKDEFHNYKMHMGYGFTGIPNHFPPSGNVNAIPNNMSFFNPHLNYGPNGYCDSVTAPQAHSQQGMLHTAAPVGLFPDEDIPGPMGIPVSSAVGLTRHQFDTFNGRQTAPRTLSNEQLTTSSLPLETQFMQNPDQMIPPNLMHSMNALVPPMGQFLSSTATNMQQHYDLNDSGGGVLTDNSNIANFQNPNRFHSKEWHKSVTFNFRNRLIRKMAQVISSAPDQNTGPIEDRMHNCISMATNIENEIYRTSNSMVQYYESMVKKTYHIMKGVNSHNAGVQYYNMQDIQQMYEALGIVYPTSPTTFLGPENAPNMRMQNLEAPLVQNLMGSNSMQHYCAYARGPSGLQPNHNHLLGTNNTSNNNTSNTDTSITDSTNLINISSAFPAGVGADMPEIIQRLAHAYKCQERENQENDVMLICSVPHCRDSKNLINHMRSCQIGKNCCGAQKEIIDHWDRCTITDCRTCSLLHQTERNYGPPPALNSQPTNQMNINPMYMRRSHRNMNNNYPSTATSGLLSNQNSSRNERISSRSPMWPYRGSWIPVDSGADNGRRPQSRYSPHSRGSSSRHDRRPPPPYNPWATGIIFVDNMRQNQSRTSMFGPSVNGRSDRLPPPYGTPWRSPDILFVENVRSDHRQPQDIDEPVIISNDEEATPSEHQQMMAIVKVVKTHGGRLEQKFRCSRKSCSVSWPCLHRRLSASIKSHETPLPA